MLNPKRTVGYECKTTLKQDVYNHLKEQGFNVEFHDTFRKDDKTLFKSLQKIAKDAELKRNSVFLCKHKKLINAHLLALKDIEPSKIRLEIREITENNSTDAIFFNWWNLAWWSMPYQKPFGRQMRFLIWDTYHDAPFGIIGLQSPVLKMAVRDKHLEIPKEELDVWVNRSMQANRVGALPPYNEILGGKCVASLLASVEIRNAYFKKYESNTTLMKQRHIDSNLLFISTTSAYGRSSIYNRLKYNDDKLGYSTGYTKGYGSFHISDELYERLLRMLSESGVEVKRRWGDGPSRRMKMIDAALKMLDLKGWHKHGIRREFFIFSHVNNLKKVISKTESPSFKNYSIEQLTNFWVRRWVNSRFENKAIVSLKYDLDTFLSNIKKL